MYIRLETSTGVPITRQIAQQIRALCASGALKPGERIPSVRSLSQDLAVNQNTILRVYERLTAEGLLERRHGDGTYVAEKLPAGGLRAQREILHQQLEQLTQCALTLGLTRQMLHDLIDQTVTRNKKTSINEPYNDERSHYD